MPLWKRISPHHQLNDPGAYHGQGKKDNIILQVIVWHLIQFSNTEAKKYERRKLRSVEKLPFRPTNRNLSSKGFKELQHLHKHIYYIEIWNTGPMLNDKEIHGESANINHKYLYSFLQ